MSYDPYSDPLNPVERGGRNRGGIDEKDPGYHVQPGESGFRGQGTSPDFMYGSGGDDPTINTPAQGVTEGFSDAQEWVSKWDPHGPDGGSYETGTDVADGD